MSANGFALGDQVRRRHTALPESVAMSQNMPGLAA